MQGERHILRRLLFGPQVVSLTQFLDHNPNNPCCILTPLFCFEGISLDSGRTLYFAFVGVVGDLPFQAKVWKQERNWQSQNMCPFCFATQDELGELVGVPGWHTDDPGPEPAATPISQLPGMGVAWKAWYDIFHLGHLGVARHFYSSTTVLACEFGLFGADRALQGKLNKAYEDFRAFCRLEGETPLAKEFTKDLS